jgi:benzoate/toluate 1,2-dioxygenase reductase subunit
MDALAGIGRGHIKFLEKNLIPGRYDFYLCGRREMIRDVTFLVDEKFPGALVFTETFY